MTDAPAAPPPAPATQAAAAAAPERLNLLYHTIIGAAIGLVSLFTGFAWPLALLTGMVIGQANVERAKGIRARASTQIIRVLAVTGGVLGMLFFGAIIGGLIAIFIVALASFSERIAAGTSVTDQVIARILISVVAFAIWLVGFVILKINFSINLGGSPAP